MKMSVIEKLWLSDDPPIVDGLFRSDGSSWSVTLEPTARDGLMIGPPLGLDSIVTSTSGASAAAVTIEASVE